MEFSIQCCVCCEYNDNGHEITHKVNVDVNDVHSYEDVFERALAVLDTLPDPAYFRKGTIYYHETFSPADLFDLEYDNGWIISSSREIKAMKKTIFYPEKKIIIEEIKH